MADHDRPTPIPTRPRQRSHDDLAAVRLQDELERERQLRAAAERRAQEAAQEARRRVQPSEPPASSKAALRVQVRDWKGLTALVTAIGSLGLGGSAWLAKAPVERVDNQAKVVQVTREDLSGVVTRLEAEERFTRKQKALNKAERQFVIQVLADGKVAIIRDADDSPMKPIESHWPRALPGRAQPDPILIVTTPYPALEWVSE